MTHQEGTESVKQKHDQNPGSRHTRSSSIASNRPSITGHGRTPSTDHLMVPERLYTLPQRKRKESLDNLRNHPISQHNPHIAQSHTHHQSSPTLSRDTKTPTPRQRELHPYGQQQHQKNEIKPSTTKGRDIRTPKPISKEPPPESREERHNRVRKLSSREVLYPTPEAAKEAFRAERAMNPPSKHRRPPTPYTSSRRASSVRRVESDRSIRSRVSFDSTRSRRSNRSNRSNRSGRTYDSDSDSDSDGTMGSKWEPSFGSNVGIGPAGEAIEVIGLGRKKPRHRTFNAGMLKPALRSTSRLNSRVDLNQNVQSSSTKREKPLPSRPMSYVAPLVNSLSKVTAPAGKKIQKRSSHQPTPTSFEHNHNGNPLLGASSSVTPTSRSVSRNNGNENGIRSLFSSLSLGPNYNTASSSRHDIVDSNSSLLNSGVGTGTRSTNIAPSRASRRHLITPADDLHSYLRYAEVQSWDRWPLTPASQKRGLGLWGGKRSLGFDEMSWEWHRRLELAEEARIQGRMLGSWEMQSRWEKGILDWLDENVPNYPIDMANRWGTQIFALPAEGFDTLEFFDETINQAEDYGLLSWVTGTLLQTAVSTLHMLRYSSSTFTFHLIPSPRPPHLPHSSSPPMTRGKNHFLWEGFGTMVLVNKNNDIDRAMILEIRPPSVVNSSVMKEFARGKNGEGWWGFHKDTCVGEVGQANVLQAQVYDDCIQNQCYFFAVTNLKYWVFGQFNSNWSRCTVSPVIHRQARDPSLMQCLSAWVVRSVDERPRAGENHSIMSSQLPTPPQENEREHGRRRRSQSRPSDVPSYSENVRSRRSNSRSSFSLPPNPQGYDYSSPAPYPQPNMGPTPVYPISTPNGTQTVFPVNMNMNVPNDYSYGLPAYSDIPHSHPQSAMSPSPYSQPTPGPGGMMFPQWNGMHVNGTSRAFSPAPAPQHTGTPMPYNFGNSWYGGGGGMFPWAGMR
ncbi:hypothetical protein I204_01277 [Kwoniella mangroviensis CBS 8886]|nr:hypothetical protein I204_01277 [Kwoniella mangroviensis CBS 8886]